MSVVQMHLARCMLYVKLCIQSASGDHDGHSPSRTDHSVNLAEDGDDGLLDRSPFIRDRCRVQSPLVLPAG